MEYISAEEFLKQPVEVQKVCCIEGCNCKTANNPITWCSKHYMQFRKYGKILKETIFDKDKITMINKDNKNTIDICEECYKLFLNKSNKKQFVIRK